MCVTRPAFKTVINYAGCVIIMLDTETKIIERIYIL